MDGLSCDLDKLCFVLHAKVAILGVYEIACLSSSDLKEKMFRITIKALSLSKTVVLFTTYVYQNHPQLSLQVHNDILQIDSVC